MAYLLIAMACFLEGEFSLLVAGFYLAAGDLDLQAVMLCSFIGVFGGDWVAFRLGRTRGEAWLAGRPQWRDRVVRMGRFMAKYHALSLIILRFQIGMRALGHFTIGYGGMAPARHLLANAAACVLWALTIPPLCLWFAKLVSAYFKALGF